MRRRALHRVSQAWRPPMVMPPSTTMCVPVTKAEVVAGQVERRARRCPPAGRPWGSAGRPRPSRPPSPPSGRRPRAACPSAVPKIEVAIRPGQMALTRIFCGDSSAAAQRRHVDHRALGGRIGQRSPAGLQAGDRGGVDDRAAAALAHQRQRRASCPAPVRAPAGRTSRPSRRPSSSSTPPAMPRVAGVVEQDVEPAERALRQRRRPPRCRPRG